MSVEKLIKAKQIVTQISENKLIILKKVRERIIDSYHIDNIDTIRNFSIIRDSAWSMIEEEVENIHTGIYIDIYDKAEILEMLIQTMFGYGILDPLINDSSITEIMVNGIDKIFIENNGRIERARNKRGETLKFNNSDELLYIIEKIVAPINRKVDESSPIVDARLPNGSRVNIVLNPISLDGSAITIRKFPENPFKMDQLVEFGTLTLNLANFLKKLIKARYNIIVSGGTGSGKTTFLNALSDYINKDSRVITIEDAAELCIINLDNLVRLEARPSNIEGKGEITIRNLVKCALRMRPDRIIVGEVRGGEALDMLQAMNTGHDGSLSTGHANSAMDMLSRLETMVLTAGVELPLTSVRQQIVSAVEIIIHLSKMQDGSRKVIEVMEILGLEGEKYVTQTLFKFEKDSHGRGEIGRLVYTGKEMKRLNKFHFSGIEPVNYKEFK